MEAAVTVCAGLHKLSLCLLVAHQEYRVPEQLTMKYWHVQLSWPVGRTKQGTNLQGPVIFLGSWLEDARKKLAAKNKNKRETKSLLCHAHHQSCIRYRVVPESWQM